MSTPADRRLWLRLQRRSASLSPDMARDLLDAYRTIRDAIAPADLERAIESGQLDRIIDDALMDRALIPLRAKVQAAVQRGFASTVKDLPKAGAIDGTLAVSFDTLNPRVIDAIRELDSRVVNTIKDDLRDVVRAHVENGIRDGVATRTIAREIKTVIGLAPNQAEAVLNYERALRGENPNAGPLDYELRDRRYDALVKRGQPMTDEQIDRAVEVYRRKMEAFNANTVSQTATRDSMRLGQRLSWDDAIAKGIVDPDNLWRRWTTVGDGRVRDEHVAMNGEEQPFANTYTNGEMVPGESTWNCRCSERFFVRRASVAA